MSWLLLILIVSMHGSSMKFSCYRSSLHRMAPECLCHMFCEAATCAYSFVSINSSSIFCVSVADSVNFEQNLMLFRSSLMKRKNRQG